MANFQLSIVVRPDFDKKVFSGSRFSYAEQRRPKLVRSVLQTARPRIPSALGRLNSLPREILLLIFELARDNQSYKIQRNAFGDLVYHPSWSCLELSSEPCEGTIYTWLRYSPFEFGDPGVLQEFCALLEPLNWQYKPTLNYIRLQVYGRLNGSTIDYNNLSERGWIPQYSLMQDWKVALSNIPGSAQQILFDFSHTGTNIIWRENQTIEDKTACLEHCWWGQSHALFSDRALLQLIPNQDASALICQVAIGLLRNPTASRMKIYSTAFNRPRVFYEISSIWAHDYFQSLLPHPHQGHWRDFLCHSDCPSDCEAVHGCTIYWY